MVRRDHKNEAFVVHEIGMGTSRLSRSSIQLLTGPNAA